MIERVDGRDGGGHGGGSGEGDGSKDAAASVAAARVALARAGLRAVVVRAVGARAAIPTMERSTYLFDDDLAFRDAKLTSGLEERAAHLAAQRGKDRLDRRGHAARLESGHILNLRRRRSRALVGRALKRLHKELNKSAERARRQHAVLIMYLCIYGEEEGGGENMRVKRRGSIT